MIQSDKEILLLKLSAVVTELYRAASFESEVTYHQERRYCEGKYDAYKTIESILQQELGLKPSEFERKVDEIQAARTLHLGGKPNGKYEIIYVDGRITTLFPNRE